MRAALGQAKVPRSWFVGGWFLRGWRYDRGFPHMSFLRLTLLLALCIVFLLPLASSLQGEAPSSPSEISEQCVMCHEDKAANLQGTPHVLPGKDRTSGSRVKVFCQDCHINPDKHLQDPSVETASKAGDMPAEQMLAVCSVCHSSRHVTELAEGNPHLTGGMTCASCHKVHRPNEPKLLKKPSVELCLECHRSVSESFTLPSHHPVKEGTFKCVDCHRVLSAFDSPFSVEGTRPICLDCHTEYDGPFPYEHGAMNDYVMEEHGCSTCHEAHGSANGRLLKEPDGRLCLRCHAVPRHFTAHGGIWAERNCEECHSDVHGSYSSQKLFNENMFGRPCFRAGCHSY
jgi:DmsE family decaheme c-type cytochrome